MWKSGAGLGEATWAASLHAGVRHGRIEPRFEFHQGKLICREKMLSLLEFIHAPVVDEFSHYPEYMQQFRDRFFDSHLDVHGFLVQLWL
jgi:hypothetical protein